MSKLLTFLKYIIGWPLSLISLVFIFKIIYSNSSALYQLSSINPFLLLLSVLSFLTYFALRVLLWHEIVKEKGNKLPFKKTAYFWEISEIKRYTPGNIWAFLSRSSLFTKENLSTKDMVNSLVSETLLIILSCFSLSVFYISYYLKNKNIDYILLFSVFLLVLGYVFSRKIDKFIYFNKVLSNIKDAIIPGLDYLTNLKIYLIALAAFFSFGLATYFSAVSIFYLDIRSITQFISLFVFSLLVGYLSIITPMGLGVREGVMTLGLSSFTSVSSAGVISIFSRVIFMLSEILFLIILWLWEKIKNPLVLKTENFLIKHKHEAFLFIFVLLYVLYFSQATFLRYDNFYTGRFDLGNMDQAVWNSINGRIFQITDPNGIDVISRLAFHADFILILISPLYLIWSDPKILLLLQTIVLSSGAFFVYLLAKAVTKNKNISLVFSLAFLLNPAVGYTNLYDFHPVTLATTFLLATFYFFYKKKYLLFFVFAILSALCKEEIWVIISIFGLYLILGNFFSYFKEKQINLKRIFFGISVFFFCISIFYYLVWIAIPSARGGGHFALSYYSDFGSSPTEVIKNIFFDPLKTFETLLQKPQLTYTLQLLAPLGFLPLVAPEFLIFALPDFLINLLSNNPQLHQIYYQYSAAITPFLFIAAIFSIKRINKKIKFIKTSWITVFLVFTVLFSAFETGPLPISKKANVDMFTKQLVNKKQIESFISLIPQNSSVATTNNLGSHLSRRQLIYTIPVGLSEADYVLFLLNDLFAQPSLEAQKEMAKSLEKSGNYILVYKDGDFVAFAKKND